MNSSHPNPQLPTWAFALVDLALIGTAAAIYAGSAKPLSAQNVLWIVGCVGVGGIVLLWPLVSNYERQKNEILDERQRALEALARTVTSSAEQISIAANGFNEIAELAQKNLRAAEQLPHKLQDKIAEFQSQLAAAEDAEKEELERELLALRTTESERLESVSQRIAKSTAEWTKLEAATQQQLAAANDAVAKLAFGTAGAIGKAQAAAEQALGQARVEAARVVGDAAGQATSAVEAARAAALAELDAKIATAVASIVDRVAADLAVRLASLQPVTVSASSTVPSPAETSSSTPPAAPESSVASSGTDAGAKYEPSAQPPKRPRKVRRDEAAQPDAGSEVSAPPAPPAVTPAVLSVPVSSAAGTSSPLPPAYEPQPVPTAKITEITPAAPDTAEPFSGHIATVPNGTTAKTRVEPESAVDAPTDATKSPVTRKRPAKKPESEEPALGLELDDEPAGIASPVGERGLTSDGATRLLVTAYIGIGNRLFIRGSGPGLSWDKGVPLQFVSIGKWRWETNDASGPVQFKLFKNDDVECTALGSLSLPPGHQQEVTAAF